MLKKFLLITLLLLASSSFASAVTQEIDRFAWNTQKQWFEVIDINSIFVNDYSGFSWQDIITKRQQVGWRLVNVINIPLSIEYSEYIGSSRNRVKTDSFLVFIWEK